MARVIGAAIYVRGVNEVLSVALIGCGKVA
jgi:hypothetical protein